MNGVDPAARIVLRDADWRDIVAMVRVERAAFPQDPWTEASFWAELAQRPRRAYVVATAEEQVAGGGALLGQAGLDLAGDVADVMTVAVDPVARGRGLGAQLLGALHDRALASGARSIMLEVRADNAAARQLYLGRGYRVVRTRPGYYRSAGGSPTVDALVMRKELVGHE